MLREIAIFLIILGMLFTGIGGMLDITKKEELTIGNMSITKVHFWNDGFYLTLLAISLLLLSQSQKSP